MMIREPSKRLMSLTEAAWLMLERDEIRSKVRSAIEQLPERFQRAILLRYESGLSSVQIAAILQVAPATIDVWIFRASKILRKYLKEYTS